jgi:hypothetical protein
MKTFNEFYSKFHEIKNQGYIKSLRQGPTGVGKTFEQLIGITENSYSLPDFIEFLTELKTKRTSSKSSLLTLYTDETGWTMKQSDFLDQYGWAHRKHIGEKTAQSTIRSKVNKRGFMINADDDEYISVSKNGVVFMKWKWDDPLDHFMKKFKNLIVVDADVKKVNDVEYFHYLAFNHYQGTSKDLFRDMIKRNKICVDLRLYTQYNLNKGVRNRGTAFRIKHKDLIDLYTSKEYFS